MYLKKDFQIVLLIIMGYRCNLRADLNSDRCDYIHFVQRRKNIVARCLSSDFFLNTNIEFSIYLLYIYINIAYDL